MYNFQEHLEADEKILYQGQPILGKGSLNLKGLLAMLIFLVGCQALMIWSLLNEMGDGFNLSFIFIFGIFTMFDILVLYSIIYNLFLKKHAVADDYFCLTNKRVFKYEEKKQKLIYGYLINYKDIKVVNEKDNYGDLYMGIILEDDEVTADELETLKELMFNPEPNNMPNITFESIENPKHVCEIAKQARRELI